MMAGTRRHLYNLRLPPPGTTAPDPRHDQICLRHRRCGVFPGQGNRLSLLAAILESRGLKVTLIKLDPYINVDPGTMSPFQHGEVFVTDDGAETDLDLGHYERFIETRMNKANNFTTGRSTSRCSRRNAAATTWARPCR
jgi:hypothetical protein